MSIADLLLSSLGSGRAGAGSADGVGAAASGRAGADAGVGSLADRKGGAKGSDDGAAFSAPGSRVGERDTAAPDTAREAGERFADLVAGGKGTSGSTEAMGHGLGVARGPVGFASLEHGVPAVLGHPPALVPEAHALPLASPPVGAADLVASVPTMAAAAGPSLTAPPPPVGFSVPAPDAPPQAASGAARTAPAQQGPGMLSRASLGASLGASQTAVFAADTVFFTHESAGVAGDGLDIRAAAERNFRGASEAGPAPAANGQGTAQAPVEGAGQNGEAPRAALAPERGGEAADDVSTKRNAPAGGPSGSETATRQPPAFRIAADPDAPSAGGAAPQPSAAPSADEAAATAPIRRAARLLAELSASSSRPPKPETPHSADGTPPRPTPADGQPRPSTGFLTHPVRLRHESGSLPPGQPLAVNAGAQPTAVGTVAMSVTMSDDGSLTAARRETVSTLGAPAVWQGVSRARADAGEVRAQAAEPLRPARLAQAAQSAGPIFERSDLVGGVSASSSVFSLAGGKAAGRDVGEGDAGARSGLFSGRFEGQSALTIPFGAPSAGSAHAQVSPMPLPTGAARIAAPQIVEAIVAMPKPGAIQIRLDPAELGRIDIDLDLSDGSLRATLVAERHATSDMLRRHLDLLAQQLEQAGFRDLDLDVGGRGADRGDSGTTRSPARWQIPLDLTAGEVIATDSAIRSESDGIDLRL